MVLLSGCITLKPDISIVSDPDYNQRWEFGNLHYDKKPGLAGYSAMGASTIAGGLAGYSADLIKYHKGTEIKSFKAGNALLGAAIGFSASYFINRSLGWGKVVKVYDAQEWLRKANNNYLILAAQKDNGAVTDITVMNRSAEIKYTVKNLYDVKDFKTAFPNSSRSSEMLSQTISNKGIERDQFIDLMELYPGNPHTMQMKEQYITRSNSIASMFSAFDKFPETGVDIEKLSVPLVSQIKDGSIHMQRFGNSKYKKSVIMNSLQKDLSEGNLKAFISLAGKDFWMTPAEIGDAPGTVKRNYLSAVKSMEEMKSMVETMNFYVKYSWLDYPGRATDITTDAWKAAYPYYSDGDALIERIFRIEQQYPDLKLSKTAIKQVVDVKLNEEIQNNIKISNLEVLDNRSEGWSEWLKPKLYDAYVVTDKEELEFLIAGTVKNESKFTLPVALKFDVPVVTKQTGRVFYFIQSEVMRTEVRFKPEYYLPLVRPSEEVAFARLIETNKKDAGVDFILGKAWSETTLGDVTIQQELLKSFPMTELKKQLAWLKLAERGFDKPNLRNAYNAWFVESPLGRLIGGTTAVIMGGSFSDVDEINTDYSSQEYYAYNRQAVRSIINDMQEESSRNHSIDRGSYYRCIPPVRKYGTREDRDTPADGKHDTWKIVFSDDDATTGYLCLGGNSGEYFIEDEVYNNNYYDNESDALKALFIYETTKRMISRKDVKNYKWCED